eukprot:scaffold7349_cov129-Skeletonema_dohrnii-CCMP3373.AAC.5
MSHVVRRSRNLVPSVRSSRTCDEENDCRSGINMTSESHLRSLQHITTCLVFFFGLLHHSSQSEKCVGVETHTDTVV